MRRSPDLPTLSRPRESLSAHKIRGSAIRDLLIAAAHPDTLSLAGGLPATDLIPASRIASVAQQVVHDSAALQYTESRGIDRCRAAVGAFEGCGPDRIVITHGSQQGIALIAQAFVDPNDVVVVDDPVYVGALQAFQGSRAQIVGLRITDSGTNTALLERLLAQGLRPRLVHTVSNFHNPAGASASRDVRHSLADLAQRYDFWIVDDDPYGRLGFDGARREPIPGARVIRLGSTSKILAPALRVGWLQAPTGVLTTIERVKQGADLCGSALNQLIAAELVTATDWLENHIAHLAAEYARRATALMESLDRHLGERIEVRVPEGGMFCWARLPGVDTTTLLGAAMSEGVAYVPGSAFAVDADASSHLRLSYATLRPEEFDEAARRLRRALDRTR